MNPSLSCRPMDPNQKPLPPPPPPPPPKNGKTRGRPPLARAKRHDEGASSAIGAGDMKAAALRRRSPRASGYGFSGSGGRLEDKAYSYGETKTPPGSSMVCLCPARDKATAKQLILPPGRKREVTGLFRDNGLPGPGTVAVVEDPPYACLKCYMIASDQKTTRSAHNKREHLKQSETTDHVEEVPSESSEEDPPTPKRRKKQKSKMMTVQPLGTMTWGSSAPRNGNPRHQTTGDNMEVQVSGSESNVTVRNVVVPVQGSSNEATENFVIIIDDDDDDDDANPVITVARSRGALGPALDRAADLAMAPAPAVAMATPIPAAHHAAATSVNIEGGAPAVAASTMALTIPPVLAPATPSITITRAPLATAVSVCVATQTTSDLVKGNTNNDSAGQAGGGSNTNNTSTAFNCRECKKSFRTAQALGGHISSYHKKGKPKLALQRPSAHKSSAPHKCKVCNHVCQTGQELSSHTITAHPRPGVAAAPMDGPSNDMYWRFPDTRSAILALPAQFQQVHQPPQAQGTMAMAGNPVTSQFPAPNTYTGWSLPAATSSTLPAIPLHNQEQNPPEQIAAAVAPGNHGYRSINPASFSFSRRQAMVPSNAIASSSSAPRPAATELYQAIGMNNYFAAIDAPANTMGHHLPFFLAGTGSDIHAFPMSRPVHQHHTTQGGTAAVVGNPVTGHFPASIPSTGWPFPATTSSALPSIPLQNQEQNYSAEIATVAHGNYYRCHNIIPLEDIAVVPSNAIASSSYTPHQSVAATTEPSEAIEGINTNVAVIDALTNNMRRLPFFPTDRSVIHAPPMPRRVHQPTQGMGTMAGNPVTGHFPTAAMAANDWSFPATSSSVVVPTIPLQNQENPPHGGVVLANGTVAGNSVTGHFPAAAMAANGWSFPTTSSSVVIPTILLQNQENPPHGGVVPANGTMASNPVTGHFLAAAMAANGWSFPATSSSVVVPTIPLQNQENPPHGGVVPANGTMASNSVTGHFSAATMAANGWSFPATSSSVVVPTIPLQNQENPPHGGVVPVNGTMASNHMTGHFPAAAMAVNGWSFPVTSSSVVVPTIPLQNQENPPHGGVVPANGTMVGNHVTDHFPAADMAANNGWSFPTTSSSVVVPTIPLQNQENPPYGGVVPANGFPSQNEADNPPEETVSDNNGGPTILLFGKKITQGQKEVKEPK